MLAIPDFRISKCIYESQKSLVYRGVRESDRLPVVLKVLKQDYPSMSELSRYRQEYAITRSLDFDGVVRTYGLEAYQNTLIMLLEDFGGESLSIRMNMLGESGRGALPLSEFFRLAIQTTAILGEIHAAGIIHKDINPSNIVYNPYTQKIKIIDFGIASPFTREPSTPNNAAMLEGSLGYLSPEQTGRMNRPLDYRTDFYSLGVTFYELLTGQLPFMTEEPLEMVHCHIALLPTPPHELNPEVPTVLSELVMKLMTKNVDDRYQSAWGIQSDLRICQQQWQQAKIISPFLLAQQDVSDRFLIPQKLYGRELEFQAMLEAFDQVVNTALQRDSSKGNQSQSQGMLCLIAGYSGIGKTALVQQLYKPITDKGGYFVSGKFDQLQWNLPYSGLVDALAELVKQLLSESEERLQAWRRRLLKALGANAQLIIDVIPELQLILGPQPPVAVLDAQEARNRFNLAFQQLIRAICTPEHPLVIFLDDLQWADSATLSWLRLILNDSQASSLLLLGSYRNNEVGPNHPLAKTVAQLLDNEVQVKEIILQPLDQAQVMRLIAETVRADEQAVGMLAEVVWRKTGGNPFFINAFLKLLHGEGLIRFDRQAHDWHWDLTHIEAHGSTENVVDLMIHRLQQLPVTTQGVLQLAACLGSRFTLTMLAIASEQDPTCVYADLCPAIEADMVVIQSPLEMEGPQLVQDYQFGHDRIQQAAYALIAQTERPAIHFKIGQLLRDNLSPEQREERLFEIVYQLNFGLMLLELQPERNRIAQLNHQAGKKAKAATAYQAALEYLQAGIDWLPADCWDSQYALSLALHECIAEVAMLNGDFDQVKHWFELVLARVKTVVDAIKVYEVQIYAYTAQKKLQEAVQIGITALQRFGFPLPAIPMEEDVQRAIEETSALLPAAGIEALIDLPAMTDYAALAAMRISYALAAPAYMASPRHFFLSALAEIRTAMRYGNAPTSAASYAHYGILLCGVIDDIEKGYQFGKLAFELAKRQDDMALNAKVALIVGTFVLAWKVHPRETLELLRQGAQDGMETGNLQAAMICRYSDALACFVIGQDLSSLEHMLADQSQQFRQFRQESHINLTDQLRQLALNLLGRSNDPCRLVGDAADETVLLPHFIATANESGLYTLYLNKLILCYLMGKYRAALDNAGRAAIHEAGVTAQVVVPLLYFYDSLTRLALADSAGEEERSDLLTAVDANQKRLKHWAAFAPQNFQHKSVLVDAERRRIRGDSVTAMAYYDAAIDGAKENGYIQDEALANELAARFYVTQGRSKIAQIYLYEACYGYTKWGAVAKVEALQTSYPQLLSQIQASHAGNSSAWPVSQNLSAQYFSLDVETIMQASRALSEEIVLAKLLKKLMQIILESSGAEQGWLLLEAEGTWCIRAAGKINEEIEVLQSIQVSGSLDSESLPLTLIQYVIRSHENLVLDNAEQAKQFLSDSYIVSRRPKSVLCVPLLHQGNLRAIVYLENNLSTMVFTKARVEMVQLLCAQASISLENAQLYAEQAAYTRLLEHRVAERTAELEQANRELQYLADLDGLTQLANRRRFDEYLAQEWKRLSREQQPLALILCDIDHFKKYNDYYGHQQGDDCLKQIANTLRQVVTRPADLVARYGGEEFVMILPFTGEEGARKVSSKLQQMIRRLKIPHPRSEASRYVTVSLGVASITPTLDITPAILIRHADTALYEAKRRGRDHWVYLKISNSLHN